MRLFRPHLSERGFIGRAVARVPHRQLASGRWQATHRYSCDRHSPREARRFCIEALTTEVTSVGPSEELIQDAALIVDELVTNAINAGCATATVRIALEQVPDATVVRLAVDDNAPGRPEPRYPTTTDTRGRGLRITDAIATDWGVHRLWRGKQVWAVLAVPASH